MLRVAASFWNSSRTSQNSPKSSGCIMIYHNYFLNANKKQSLMFIARLLVSINLDFSFFLLRNHPKPASRTRNKMQAPCLKINKTPNQDISRRATEKSEGQIGMKEDVRGKFLMFHILRK